MVKDIIISQAKNGEYGFAIDRIMRDYRVKHAYRFNYLDCLREALIDYFIEQIAVAKYYGYCDEVVIATLDNLEKQANAFQRFENDWNVACLLDDIYSDKVLNSFRKEGVING